MKAEHQFASFKVRLVTGTFAIQLVVCSIALICKALKPVLEVPRQCQRIFLLPFQLSRMPVRHLPGFSVSSGNAEREEPVTLLYLIKEGQGRKRMGRESHENCAPVPLLVHIYCHLQSWGTALPKTQTLCTSRICSFFFVAVLFLPELVYFLVAVFPLLYLSKVLACTPQTEVSFPIAEVAGKAMFYLVF